VVEALGRALIPSKKGGTGEGVGEEVGPSGEGGLGTRGPLHSRKESLGLRRKWETKRVSSKTLSAELRGKEKKVKGAKDLSQNHRRPTFLRLQRKNEVIRKNNVEEGKAKETFRRGKKSPPLKKVSHGKEATLFSSPSSSGK